MPPSLFLLHFLIANHKRSRVPVSNFRFCENAFDLNVNGSQLIVSTLSNEAHMDCTCTLCRSLVTGNSTHLISSLNPVLSMRFAVSLKRSADPEGGQEWELSHFSSVNFASQTPPDMQASSVRENIEMDFIDTPNNRRRVRWS